MICEKCGMEMINQDDPICQYCRQATPGPEAESESEPTVSPEKVYLDLDNSAKDSSSSQEEFDEKVDLTDPIDFIMGQSDYEPEAESSPSEEKPAAENVTSGGDDFPVIRFDSGIGSSLSSETAVTVSEKKETAVEPETPKPSNDFGSVEAPQTSDSTEETPATKKINISDTKTEPETSGAREEKPSVTIQPENLPHVARPKGVILLDGDKLCLSAGIKVHSGEEIQIGDRLFEVRPKLKDQRKKIAIISAGAAALLIIILLLGGFLPLGNGQLIGVVTGGSGNHPLPGQTVRIDELNKTVTTNQAGFFIFDGLDSGLYTVQYLKDGEPVGEQKIAVIDNEVTTITLTESDDESYISEPDEPVITRSEPAKTESQSKDESKIATVKLSVSPRDAYVYLDDKPLGKGSNTYRVKPGKYVMSAKKKGYHTKAQNINLTDGKTYSYNMNLSKVASKPKKTEGEIAYQNEIAGNYHEALRYYDKVLGKNPKDVGAILGKARCYRGQGLVDQATTYYTQASSIAGASGDVSTQIDALSAIIEIRPNTLLAYSTRGDAYYSEREYNKAARDYETVITMDRRNLAAIYKLGNSYYYAREYNKALAAFKAAEELNFADPKAYVCQAKTYLMMGDQKNMKKSYEKCKELSTYAARLEFKNDPDWQKVLDALGITD